jgi:ATP-dependent RNA helicase RhlE
MNASLSGLATTSRALPPLRTQPAGFAALGLIPPLCRAVAVAGYQAPTPIQARAIPHLLAGRDLHCCAPTGTGKTAAFALPILDRLARTRRDVGRHGPRALILAPTRELAVEIADAFDTYGRHLSIDCGVVVGGVGQGARVDALRRGSDIVVATPERLLDLLGQGHAPLAAVEMFVLDEADRILDMGFIEPIRRIVAALPPTRQTLMFSATMPRALRKLADALLDDPADVTVAPVASAADPASQRVLHVRTADKQALLVALLRDPAMRRVLVFARTKHGANRLVEHLVRAGETAAAIHGDKTQGARQRALAEFEAGGTRVLVATDVAARGLDVEGVTHVISLEVPGEPETYVARSGRAGAAGVALSFCDDSERTALRAIERLIRRPLSVVEAHAFAAVGWTAAGARTPAGARHGKS